MTETAEPLERAHAATASRTTALARVETRDFVVFAAATAAAWAHTIDEVRIGELVAVPFGALNLVLLGAWPRLRRGPRAAGSILFGLFWGLAVIPFHVVPLVHGVVTGQHVSGVSRVVAGAAMVVLGIAIARRRTPSTP
jgi:hypothetical protein